MVKIVRHLAFKWVMHKSFVLFFFVVPGFAGIFVSLFGMTVGIPQ